MEVKWIAPNKDLSYKLQLIHQKFTCSRKYASLIWFPSVFHIDNQTRLGCCQYSISKKKTRVKLTVLNSAIFFMLSSYDVCDLIPCVLRVYQKTNLCWWWLDSTKPLINSVLYLQHTNSKIHTTWHMVNVPNSVYTHLYLCGVWLGVNLRMDIKKAICVEQIELHAQYFC